MKFTIKTIGCKVNTYESMKLRDELIGLGFNYIDVEEKEKYSDLDYYIVNTCSVTKIADKKSRQMLHLAKKYNPNVKVIAIGCMVDSMSLGAKHREPVLDGIDYIISNKQKPNLAKFISSLIGTNDRKDFVGVKLCETNVVADTIRPHEGVKLCEPVHRIRAFIKIQDGCNQYCTYCIIPFLRGNIKSRDNDDIIKEIKEKVECGVKEIVLTGIHLSSFGLDRVNKTYESTGAIDIARKELLTIMSKIAEIDGVERIRLGSLEPRIIDEKFIKYLLGKNVKQIVHDDSVGKSNIEGAQDCQDQIIGASSTVGAKLCESAIVGLNLTSPLAKKFCANFCLSLQSGCDKTLKRMNRHYTTVDFENACNLIRKYLPYATITTDVIVGFPGETEEEFNESLEFVKRMRFYNPNIFPYSRRQGTKADKMPNQLTNEEKHNRSVLMISECEKISKEIEKEYFEKYSDRAKDILIEEYIEKDGIKLGIGYTREYIKIIENS